MYFFEGQPRLAIWHTNPNLDGCLFILLSFLLLTLAGYLSERRRTWLQYLALPLHLLVCICLMLISETYSRGSYVAFFAVSLAQDAVMLWRLWREWKTRNRQIRGISLFHKFFCLLLPLLLFLFIQTLPAGGRRLRRIVDVQHDASVTNRLALWRGGTIIIHRHWLAGIHRKTSLLPGTIYAYWLQPPGINEMYNSLISDPLTITAQYGLPLAFLLLLLTFGIPASAFSLWLRTKDSFWVLHLLFIPVAFFLCGIFNTCSSEPLLWEMTLAVQLFLLGWILIARQWRNALRPLPYIAVFALLLCCGVYAFGAVSERNLPFSIDPLPLGPTVKEVSVKNNRPVGARKVLFFSRNIRGDFHACVLPLLGCGAHFQLYECQGGIPSIATIREQLKNAMDKGGEIAVIASGPNAANTVYAALAAEPGLRPRLAVFWDLALVHAFEELSPSPTALPYPIAIHTDTEFFQDIQKFQQEAFHATILGEDWNSLVPLLSEAFQQTSP